jgi:succinate dehydrogenase / fumarate reductase iron-sulfur subunit
LKSMQEKMRLRIQRFDPKVESAPHYDTFEISPQPGMTVLDALFRVLDKDDPSLTFRHACRSAVCGSCAMFINGRPRLACNTQMNALSSPITVGPLPHLPVVRDLIVDLHPFYQKFDSLKPYFEAQEPYPEREFIQTPKERAAIGSTVDCIDCGACFSSCPLTWTDPRYPGPAAFVKAYRFVADTRDNAHAERLQAAGCEDGVWRCHTVFNCADSCPKAISPTLFIQELKRKATRLAVGQLRPLPKSRSDGRSKHNASSSWSSLG